MSCCLLFDDDGAFQILVACSAEDVAVEHKAAGLLWNDAHARRQSWEHIRAHAQVRQIESVRNVQGLELQDQWSAEGLRFYVVSDIASPELGQLVTLLRSEISR